MQFYPDIYIVWGGSNASGRGLVTEAPIYPNYTKILNYSNAGKWVYATEPYDSTTNQVDAVSSDASPPAAGLAIPFANKLYDLRPGRYVGLVPCAMGGSTIDDWARDLDRSTLYGSMIARAQEAATAGTLKGFIWCGGVDSAGSTAEANAWGAKFLQLFTDMKGDLGSSLKSVLVCLGPDPVDVAYPAWGTLLTNQLALTLPSGMVRVETSDLAPDNDDGLHFPTASYITIGERCAAAMANALT